MEENYWIILSKHFAGELSEEEEKELALWIDADVKNRKLFEEAQKTWDKGSFKEVDFTPDSEAAWEKVKSKSIEKTKVIPLDIPKRNKNRLFPILKIAASIVLVIGLLFIVKQMTQKNNAQYASSGLEKYTTTSGKKLIHLADGSNIWLNKNTSLSCAADFNKEQRVVYLTGEAFFEVARNENKPFIIYSGISKTRVLGTAFNLRAYENEKNIELVVAHGKVSFSAEAKELILEKGDKGSIDIITKEVLKSANDDINSQAWQQEKLVFNKTEFKKVVSELEKYFSIHIEIKSPALLSCSFTGTFEKPVLEDILKTFKITMNIDYKKEKNKIILDGKGCK